MIVKSPDSKTQDLEILESLQKHPDANAETRKRIEQEIRNIRAGIRGEEEAAYEMRVHYGQSENWAIIHDLRVEHGGLVAQIDHLLINRFLDIWVCESKHFSEGVAVNEYGEFAAFYASKPYGVPSPIEQNAKHLLILERVFESGAVEFPRRLGMTIRPNLRSLVLVSKKARISRPKKPIPGIEQIVKNDQLHSVVSAAKDQHSVLALSRVIGIDTLKALGEQIAKLHKPAKFDWAAKFGLANTPAVSQEAAPTEIPEKPASSASEKEAAPQPEKPKQKLECHSCGVSVAYNVARFCWLNKAKFDGQVFCMDCQKSHQKIKHSELA